MTLAIWYWIFFILGIVLGGFIAYTPGNRWWFGAPLIYTILFFILGLAVFGSPIRG
jgi:hypothetical protein